MNRSRHANANPWKTMIIDNSRGNPFSFICFKYMEVLNICLCCKYLISPTDPFLWTVIALFVFVYLYICVLVYLCICVYLTPPTDPSLWTVIALWGWVGYLGDTCCLIFLHIFKTDQITKVEKAVFTAHNMWLKCITYMSTISVSHMEKKTKRTRALAGALYAVMCSSSSGAAPNYALKVKIPFDCQGYSTFTPTRNASWSWWYLNVVFVSTLSVSVSA